MQPPYPAREGGGQSKSYAAYLPLRGSARRCCSRRCSWMWHRASSRSRTAGGISLRWRCPRASTPSHQAPCRSRRRWASGSARRPLAPSRPTTADTAAPRQGRVAACEGRRRRHPRLHGGRKVRGDRKQRADRMANVRSGRGKVQAWRTDIPTGAAMQECSWPSRGHRWSDPATRRPGDPATILQSRASTPFVNTEASCSSARCRNASFMRLMARAIRVTILTSSHSTLFRDTTSHVLQPGSSWNICPSLKLLSASNLILKYCLMCRNGKP